MLASLSLAFTPSSGLPGQINQLIAKATFSPFYPINHQDLISIHDARISLYLKWRMDALKEKPFKNCCHYIDDSTWNHRDHNINCTCYFRQNQQL
jgi:hypothetical protein